MNETKKPAVRFKGFSVEWERHPMDELTTELHEYATLDSLYPLLTSSREGIMFQNEYRSNRTTENNKTLFSIVPYGKCTYRHKSFATLTQEEQKYANIFLHDVQNGDVVVDEGKTLRDYITEYMTSAKNDQIHRFAEALGADETMLRDFMQLRVTEANINEFGRFDKLKATVNRDSAKVFLETLEGAAIKPFQINMKVDRILRKFILEGGFDIA